MDQIFVTLQHLLKDTTVTTFIQHFDDRRIFQYNDYFLLEQERINRLFQQNLTALQGTITISEDFFDTQTKVVAMTIDGDFILANDSRTYVLPRTFVKADLEVYEMPVIEFFVQYETQVLRSNIISSPPAFVKEEIAEMKEETLSGETENKGFFSRLFGKK